MAEFGIVSFVVRIEHSTVLGGQKKWVFIVQIEVGTDSRWPASRWPSISLKLAPPVQEGVEVGNSSLNFFHLLSH